MESNNRSFPSQRKGRGNNNGKRAEKGLSQDTPLTALSVEDKLRLASEVESRLAEESDEERGSKLRIQLCQYLSDIILTDPVVAIREESVNRLWRVCFYARINKLRVRINREAKKKGENKAALEDSLKRFLEEAIVLYEFMVKKLEESVSGMSETDGHSTVACIYRLLIHLGDLYRYQRSDSKAEGCYMRASRLSPGRGNSYNQLAVVAQQASFEGGHPKTCLALYWYARSLMASVDPFEISRSNLTRLFYFNRTWLKNNPPPTAISSTTNKRILTNHKSFVLRRFMAEFVDLQSFLLKMPDAPSTEKVVTHASSLFDNFQSLLQDQSFGDSLLAKMAVILMFVVVYIKTPEDDDYPQLPLSCALRFGHTIASYLKSQSLSSSLRALSPLLVFCLWLQNLPSNALPLKEDTDVVNSKDFWTCIADLGNHLQATFTTKQLANVPNDKHLPIENELRGFSPLLSKTEKVSHPSSLSGFLPLNDSIEILSQESRNNSNGSEHDFLRKVARFLLILRNLAATHSDKEAWPLLYDETTHVFSIHTSEPSSQNMGIDLAASTSAPQSEPMDDFADDEIVYTGSVNDNKEVPIAMDIATNDPSNLFTNPYTSGLLKSAPTPISDKQEVKPIQASIKPPPGFSGLPTPFLPSNTINNQHPSMIPPPQTLGKMETAGIIGTSKFNTPFNQILPNPPAASSVPPGFESFSKHPTTSNEAVNADFNQLSQWPPFLPPEPSLKAPMKSPWPTTANPFVGQATGAEGLIGSSQPLKSLHTNPPGFPFLHPAPNDDSDSNMPNAAMDENEFQFLGSLMFDSSTGFTNTASSQSMKDSPPTTRNPFML